MKKITAILSLLTMATMLSAQSPKFEDGMTKALAQMDTASNAASFLSAGNTFERIAKAEKNQWLPYYYSALCRVTGCYMTGDVAKYDAILDVAFEHISIADSLSPDNSEIYVVRSMINGARIAVDPMTRGQQYGMMTMMQLSKAMSLDPNNPRAFYVMGQSLMYTPEQYGGGKDKACPMLFSAKSKYASFVPAGPLYPNWGAEQLDEALKQCGSVPDGDQ